jgi:hypothetical protein
MVVGRDTIGNHRDVGMIAVHRLVQGAQEIDRFEILPAAEAIRYPFSRLAGVVEVQHRGDRVDPDAVDVVLLEPEERR